MTRGCSVSHECGAVVHRFGNWLRGLGPRFVHWCRTAPRRFVAWAKRNPQEGFGYIVWGGVAAGVTIPEVWAAADSKHVPWPTISGMTGHLEVEHVWVSFIVVGLLVWVASHAVLSIRDTGSNVRPVDGTGRVTTAGQTSGVPAAWYFGTAAVLLTIGIVAAHAATKNDKYTFGEILYGLIFFFGAILPGLLAWRGRIVPFPTLFANRSTCKRRGGSNPSPPQEPSRIGTRRRLLPYPFSAVQSPRRPAVVVLRRTAT